MENIQLFVPTFRTEECLAEIRECLEKGWTGLGFKTVQLEKDWSQYTGHPFSHFINSNTSGLHLAVHIFKTKFGWQDGDEIITTPLTFISSNHAIMYEKMKPVFADVDETLCLCPEDVERKITPKTRAVLYVGLGGNTGHYRRMLELCQSRNLKLILDAAHMAGTRFEGKHVGPEADVTVYSFQAVKNLPTADSGMICFANPEDDERCRKLTWLGINKDTFSRSTAQGNYKWMYGVEEVGFKYHGNSIMAGIALVQLKYLDEDNQVRRNFADLYDRKLRGTEGIAFPKLGPDCVSSRHLFQIRVASRDQVLMKLNEKGIFPGVHYRDNTEYPMYAYGAGTCPNAAKASKELISLPLHLRMDENDVTRICETVQSLVKSH